MASMDLCRNQTMVGLKVGVRRWSVMPVEVGRNQTMVGLKETLDD